MQLDRQWFEDWRPRRTDHDAGINVLVRLATLPEVVGTQTGIGRLQRFGYGHKEPDRFRLVGLGKEVVELADEIHPIHRSPTPVLMIAAIQNNLQLIPIALTKVDPHLCSDNWPTNRFTANVLSAVCLCFSPSWGGGRL